MIKSIFFLKFSTILSRVCFAHNPTEEQKAELLSIEPVQFFTDDESFKTKYNEVLLQLISNIITRFDTLVILLYEIIKYEIFSHNLIILIF